MGFKVEQFGDIPRGPSKYAYISEPPTLFVCSDSLQHSAMSGEIGNRPVSSAGVLVNISGDLMVNPFGSATLGIPPKLGEAGNVVEHIQSLPGAENVNIVQSRRKHF